MRIFLVLSSKIYEAFCLKSGTSDQCVFQPEIYSSIQCGCLYVLIDGHVNEQLYDKRAFSDSFMLPFCYL